MFFTKRKITSMENSALCNISILIFLFLSFNSGGNLKLANGQGQTWCVAKPSSTEAEMSNNIQYVCDLMGETCNVIAEGGSCYFPNSLINHASVAMNLYYSAYGRNTWNCDFTNSGLITIKDPSYGDCKYV